MVRWVPTSLFARHPPDKGEPAGEATAPTGAPERAIRENWLAIRPRMPIARAAAAVARLGLRPTADPSVFPPLPEPAAAEPPAAGPPTADPATADPATAAAPSELATAPPAAEPGPGDGPPYDTGDDDPWPRVAPTPHRRPRRPLRTAAALVDPEDPRDGPPYDTGDDDPWPRVAPTLPRRPPPPEAAASPPDTELAAAGGDRLSLDDLYGDFATVLTPADDLGRVPVAAAAELAEAPTDTVAAQLTPPDDAVDPTASSAPVPQSGPAPDTGPPPDPAPAVPAAADPFAGPERDTLRRLEALLFASAEPVTEDALARHLGAEGAKLGLALETLQAVYADRGVNLVRMDRRWAFRTAPDLASMLRIEQEATRKPSRAAVETLAIIAYHQPVTRAEIESIRGVATSKGTLDLLMETGWVRPGRRRESPGRPLTWITTNDFLDHFGLGSLRDLPGLEDLRAAGLLDTKPMLAPLPGATEDETDAEEDEEDEEDEEADAHASLDAERPDEPGRG